MVQEVDDPNKLKWKSNWIGKLPTADQTRLLFLEGNNLLPNDDSPRFHSMLRSLKQAFLVDVDQYDREILSGLQKSIEVSVIADLYRSVGYEIDSSAVNHVEAHLDRMRDLGISQQPIMLAARSDIYSAEAMMRALVDEGNLSQLFASRLHREEFQASSKAVASKMVIDIGLLSQGIPIGFNRLLARMDGLTDDQRLEILNENFGFAAVEKTNDGHVRAGVSSHIMDRIFEKMDDENFELWICDDTIVLGETFKAMTKFFVDSLKQVGKTQAEVDTFMQKVKLFTQTQNPDGICEIDSKAGTYTWRLKPAGLAADNKKQEIKVPRIIN